MLSDRVFPLGDSRSEAGMTVIQRSREGGACGEALVWDQAGVPLKNGRSIIVSSRLGPVEMMLAGMPSNSSSLRT